MFCETENYTALVSKMITACDAQMTFNIISNCFGILNRLTIGMFEVEKFKDKKVSSSW